MSDAGLSDWMRDCKLEGDERLVWFQMHCRRCNHPRGLHTESSLGRDVPGNECRAVGCRCLSFVAPEEALTSEDSP